MSQQVEVSHSAMQMLVDLSHAPHDGEKLHPDRMRAICAVGHDRDAFVRSLDAPVPPAGDLPEWAQIQILKNGIGERDGDIERLEAELTKVRERQKHLESFLKIASERIPKKHRTIKLHIDQCLRDAHQSAPAAKAERSPKDYAIEHAEYLATAADSVDKHFNAYGLALMALEEADDDADCDELLESLDTVRQDLQESLTNLRSMTYEFRKRRDRAIKQ